MRGQWHRTTSPRAFRFPLHQIRLPISVGGRRTADSESAALPPSERSEIKDPVPPKRSPRRCHKCTRVARRHRVCDGGQLPWECSGGGRPRCAWSLDPRHKAPAPELCQGLVGAVDVAPTFLCFGGPALLHARARARDAAAAAAAFRDICGQSVGLCRRAIAIAMRRVPHLQVV